MNTFYKLLLLVLIGIVSSCEFLDIVPDERPTDSDAFEDRNAAYRYLYSCYSYMPSPKDLPNGIDLLTANELVSTSEHQAFASFMKGNYTPSNQIISHWKTLYQGIRQCYMLLENLDKVPDLTEEEKKDYIAQANFLIGYYHYRLALEYGPIILMKGLADFDISVSEYAMRSPYDECVDFICEKFDEAAADLPASRAQIEYGLATSVAAKALKAKILLYAASPLYNGNSDFYSDFKDANGTLLISTSYDQTKWDVAKVAFEEAIALAETNGYKLYEKDDYDNGNKQPVDPIQHRLRYVMMEPGNSEIIWADNRSEGAYGMQNASLPFVSGAAFSSQGPVLSMIDRFYTDNGLPIDVDPTFDNESKLDVVVIEDKYASVAEPGRETLRMNLNREPRFYAWIGFQGGYYELTSAPTNGGYTNDPSYQKHSVTGSSKLVCDFTVDGNCGRASRTSDYSMTCYLNKKGVDPAYSISTSLKNAPDYPWPVIRMADLYLGYAEVCVETNDLDKAKTYLNKVRIRAGIPSVEESWESIAGIPLDQNRMRAIVRQERLIEFYMECQQFWDVRRWKIADQFLGVKVQGLNTNAATVAEMGSVYEIPYERNFAQKNYLMPIPQSEINKDPNLVQNPGY